MRDAYVAGVGAITPLAVGWRETAELLAAGESAVGPITSFDTTDFPCTVAAAIREETETEDRRLALAIRAADEAVTEAGVPITGVFIGAESGRATLPAILALSRAAGGDKTFDHEQFGRRGRDLATRIDAAVVSPAAVASHLAARFGATGPAVTISIACASGAAAIVEAARAIRLGVCDTALAGGVGADIDPLMIAGFGKLGALSAHGRSRPFDVRRDGFVVGEGAAMVVLTAAPTGVAITGVGRTLDAHHLTAPHPEGSGAERAMRAALTNAGNPSIGAVQAHGTSTPLNDAIEAKAIRRVFGSDADHIPVSSVKGALGHWIAGAGAVGFVCGVHAVQTGEVFPTAHLEEPDSECPVAHVIGTAERRDVRAALVNSFAFGGANASLVVERRE